MGRWRRLLAACGEERVRLWARDEAKGSSGAASRKSSPARVALCCSGGAEPLGAGAERAGAGSPAPAGNFP